MNSNFVPCAFVNDIPTKAGPVMGYLVTENDGELVLEVTQTMYYRHPECCEVMLTVPEHTVVGRARKGDKEYSAYYLLMMAQQNLKYA